MSNQPVILIKESTTPSRFRYAKVAVMLCAPGTTKVHAIDTRLPAVLRVIACSEPASVGGKRSAIAKERAYAERLAADKAAQLGTTWAWSA